eukprot:5930017-Alexandrium_andersonii.AAC.1
MGQRRRGNNPKKNLANIGWVAGVLHDSDCEVTEADRPTKNPAEHNAALAALRFARQVANQRLDFVISPRSEITKSIMMGGHDPPPKSARQ